MSDQEEAAQEPQDGAGGGPQAPFRVYGSDGSERGPYAHLAAAQEAHRQLTENHAERKLEFVVRDASGESV